MLVIQDFDLTTTSGFAAISGIERNQGNGAIQLQPGVTAGSLVLKEIFPRIVTEWNGFEVVTNPPGENGIEVALFQRRDGTDHAQVFNHAERIWEDGILTWLTPSQVRETIKSWRGSLVCRIRLSLINGINPQLLNIKFAYTCPFNLTDYCLDFALPAYLKKPITLAEWGRVESDDLGIHSALNSMPRDRVASPRAMLQNGQWIDLVLVTTTGRSGNAIPNRWQLPNDRSYPAGTPVWVEWQFESPVVRTDFQVPAQISVLPSIVLSVLEVRHRIPEVDWFCRSGVNEDGIELTNHAKYLQIADRVIEIQCIADDEPIARQMASELIGRIRQSNIIEFPPFGLSRLCRTVGSMYYKQKPDTEMNFGALAFRIVVQGLHDAEMVNQIPLLDAINLNKDEVRIT